MSSKKRNDCTRKLYNVVLDTIGNALLDDPAKQRYMLGFIAGLDVAAKDAGYSAWPEEMPDGVLGEPYVVGFLDGRAGLGIEFLRWMIR